jgi:CRISPR system Cascade subunit CasC
MLTSYPPANLNRDDLGRPKTAVMGNKQRLRVSSQCLKRTWRTAEIMQQALKGHLGTRTRSFEELVFKPLIDAGIEAAKAEKWTLEIMEAFKKSSKKEKTQKSKKKAGAKKEDEKKLNFGHLIHFSAGEMAALSKLVAEIIQNKKGPGKVSIEQLLTAGKTNSLDVALFGRMMAEHTSYNIEAAAQVAHALSVHEVVVEEDFFSAVDDLQEEADDQGAGHIGEAEFAAGLFYLYACINRDLLVENLGGDEKLASQGIRALVEAMATASPTGKRASYGSFAYANYCLAEKGSRQPRSLSVAFLEPVSDRDMLGSAIKALEKVRGDMDQCYGPCSDDAYIMNVPAGKGALNELLDFAAE